jgi:small subunit ribosomal protein S4
MERRPTRPGQHGRGRIKDTDYKARLLEKQRLCAQYKIGERQLRRAVKRAMRRPGRTGEELPQGPGGGEAPEPFGVRD